MCKGFPFWLCCYKNGAHDSSHSCSKGRCCSSSSTGQRSTRCSSCRRHAPRTAHYIPMQWGLTAPKPPLIPVVRKARTIVHTRVRRGGAAVPVARASVRPVVPAAADTRRARRIARKIVIVAVIRGRAGPGFAGQTHPRETTVNSKPFYISVCGRQFEVHRHIIFRDCTVCVFCCVRQILRCVGVGAFFRPRSLSFQKNIRNPFKGISIWCFFPTVHAIIFAAFI